MTKPRIVYWLCLILVQVSEARWPDSAQGREAAAESWEEAAEGRGEGDQEEAEAGEERSGVERSLQRDRHLGPCPRSRPVCGPRTGPGFGPVPRPSNFQSRVRATLRGVRAGWPTYPAQNNHYQDYHIVCYSWVIAGKWMELPQNTPAAFMYYVLFYLFLIWASRKRQTLKQSCSDHPLCTQTRGPKVSCSTLVPTMTALFLDENLPDGTCLEPGTKFIKYWKMKNTGNISWTSDTKVLDAKTRL